MRRRDFIKLSAAGSAILPTSLWARVKVNPPPFETILKNGKIFIDDSWQVRHVGVDAVGKMSILPSLPSEGNIIDVGNRIISPGFIDILADNAANPEKSYKIFEKYKVSNKYFM